MVSPHLPHLATFIQAAERGSFTAAARALLITQAAISQRIGALETEVGAKLFLRPGGRVALTDAGRKLLDYAKRIVDLHTEARLAIHCLAAEISGELVVVSSSVPGSHILPPALASYRRSHPRVTVRVCVNDSAQVLRMVESGEADLGLAGVGGPSQHLIFTRLVGDELVLIVPANHRLGERKRVGLREFLGLPLIQREKGSGSRRCLERAVANVGHDPKALNNVFEIDGNEAIKESVRQGLGLAVLSRRSVQHECLDGSIRSMPITGLNLERDLFAVHDRRRRLSSEALAFLSHLQMATSFST